MPPNRGSTRELLYLIVCHSCGHVNQVSSNYCSSCGQSLVHHDDTTDILTTTELGSELGEDFVMGLISSVRPGSGVLVVKTGPSAGTSFFLEKDKTTIGRHPESDIFLDDVTVSRRHAEFVKAGVEYSISDVGSLNGTYVNHSRSDFSVIKSGDEVQIGKYRLLFILAPKE